MNVGRLIENNRPLAWMAMLGVLIWGAWSAGQMLREDQPVGRVGWIKTYFLNTAPPDVERLVTEKVEAALAGQEGITAISSSSFREVSYVRVELRDAARNPVQIWSEVRRRLGAIHDLPPASERPELKVSGPPRSLMSAAHDVGNLAAMLSLAIFLAGVTALPLAGWRSAVVLVPAMVLSVALTAGISGLLHVGLNQMTIGALALGLGFVIADTLNSTDAIARELAVGRPRADAMSLAMGRLVRPGIYTTLLALAILLPLLTVRGQVGATLWPADMVLVSAAIAGRVVSMTFVPLLGARLLRGEHGLDARPVGKTRPSPRPFPFISRCVGRPVVAWCACLVLLIAGGVAAYRAAVRVRLTPWEDGPTIEVRMLGPDIAVLDELAAQVSHDLDEANNLTYIRSRGTSDAVGPDLKLVPHNLLRYRGERCVRVSCDVPFDVSPLRVAHQIEARFEQAHLPPGYRYELTDGICDEIRGAWSLGRATAVALVAAYLLLLIQLKGFIRPVTALASAMVALAVGPPLLLLLPPIPIEPPVIVALAVVAALALGHASMLLCTIQEVRSREGSSRQATISATLVRARPTLGAALPTGCAAAAIMTLDGWALPVVVTAAGLAAFAIVFLLMLPAQAAGRRATLTSSDHTPAR